MQVGPKLTNRTLLPLHVAWCIIKGAIVGFGSGGV